jgi:putative solute:sodium symporter small subunit
VTHRIDQLGRVVSALDLAYKLCVSMDQHPGKPASNAQHEAYWRRNIRYVGILLGIWFSVSYGCGIVFVEALNAFRIPGTNFPVGFWFAQQGSIYVFVILIFVYVRLMNRLDREFDLDEKNDT